MKILIIGASGKIGSAIVKELSQDTTLVTANHTSGDFTIDLGDRASITQLFTQTGPLDGVVCAAARGVVFKPVPEMNVDDYLASMQQKMLGQMNVALQSLKVLNDHGSITLTTGVFNRDFVKNGSAAATVNNAIEGFVKSASLDLPRGIRMNVVSPGLIEESAALYAAVCPGFAVASSANVAKAYRRSVYGIQTGQVFCVA